MIKQLVQSILTGGAPKAHKSRGLMLFSALVAIILSLFVRAILVNIGWNLVMPKIVSSLSENPGKVMTNFRPLTFSDALILVILVSSLVNM
jgi:hypothetical protein